MENDKVRVFLGFTANKKPEILEYETKPTKETHPQYDFIYGPFESTKKAQKYIQAMGGVACGDG